LKILFTLFAKQPKLIRRSTVLTFPPQLVFPGQGFECIKLFYIRWGIYLFVNKAKGR
jgi:hypothetical protein